jgi:very-short-patch-repair endonuclease
MANELARKLRKTMTPQEVKLWAHLRPLRDQGFKFRRQVPLRGYIVDFACFGARIIIEIDGSQHGSTSTLSEIAFTRCSA